MVTTPIKLLTVGMRILFILIGLILANHLHNTILAISTIFILWIVYDAALALQLKKREKWGNKLRLRDALKVNSLLISAIYIIVIVPLMLMSAASFGEIMIGQIMFLGLIVPLILTIPTLAVFAIVIYIDKYRTTNVR